MPRGWIPYRGDGLPRRDSDHYIPREKSLLKRRLTLLLFALIGALIGYYIGTLIHKGTGPTIFASVISLIIAVIAYFAKEDAEKIDIHDLDKIPDENDDYERQ